MSTEHQQPELTDFDEGAETNERPNWDPTPAEPTSPDAGYRVECELCEATVTKQFVRVFGDNNDRVVNGCPECSTFPEIKGDDRSNGGNGQ